MAIIIFGKRILKDYVTLGLGVVMSIVISQMENLYPHPQPILNAIII